MKQIDLDLVCPKCGEELQATPEIMIEDIAPDVQSDLIPNSIIFSYKITSTDIKNFIIKTARNIAPGVDVEVGPRYCEKKRKKPTDPHHSYASLRIAFSDKAIQQGTDSSFYGKIGQGEDTKMIDSLFYQIYKKYAYDKKTVDAWLNSYKTLEELEEKLGMSSAYINDIKVFSTPQRIPTSDGGSWVMFAAAPEKVILDMLTDAKTKQMSGVVKIQDVYLVSKEVVEFVVHLYPNEVQLKEDPRVRQILLGEEKLKK